MNDNIFNKLHKRIIETNPDTISKLIECFEYYKNIQLKEIKFNTDVDVGINYYINGNFYGSFFDKIQRNGKEYYSERYTTDYTYELKKEEMKFNSNNNIETLLSENKQINTKIESVEDFIRYLNTLSNEELKKEMKSFGIEFKLNK